jgi:hypothetical protein
MKHEDTASLFSGQLPVPMNRMSTSPDQHVLGRLGGSLSAPAVPQASTQVPLALNVSQPTEPPDLPPLKSFQERANSTTTQTSDEQVPPPRSELTTMQGALVFLARAAGTIARADDRDHIDGRDKHEQLEVERLDDPKDPADNIAPLIRPQGNTPTSVPPVERGSNVRPNPSKSLSDIEYIGEGKMLTETEAEHLIHLFFLTMHPFFPHIPEQLQYPGVLAGYPILLCAILTISSRYHPFGDDDTGNINKNSRNIQLHERLWIYCQRLISQTIWAEASTRSVGTVLAFLLFTEWNPRAIHWRWSDYANMPATSRNSNFGSDDLGEDDDATEGLTGLSAMRRSDRMAWMLVGTSVRLAQDMGFINGSTKIFVATHIAETNTAMNLGQRSMLAQSLSEIDLDNEDEGEAIDNRKQFLHDEFILTLDEETMRQRSLQKKRLRFTFMQKAKLELLKIMSLAYETVYCGGNQLELSQHRQNLTVLSVLSPLIEHWYKTYKKLLKPSNPKNFNHHCNLNMATNPKHVREITKQIDKESLICDYYYCQLYIYSLALSMENPLNSNVQDTKKPLNNIRLDEISKAAKYVELAYNAAKEILNVAVRVHKIKMLKYMPVRFVTRVVRSVAFIVKCYLTLTNTGKQPNQSTSQQTSTLLTLSIVPTEDILQTIQKAAIVLREASPDELHLCTRYSTILMYLCSEMKYRSKLMVNPPNVTPLDTGSSDDDMDAVANQMIDNGQIPTMSQQSQQPQPQTTPQTGIGLDGAPFYMGYQQMRDTSVQPLPDAVVDWFMKNDEAIGLDFVEPWTEMIEQHLDKQKI